MKKREHITRVLVRGTAALLTAAILTGCGKVKLPEGFEESAVKEKAEQSIELFNARDYEALWEMGSDELKESITVEQFAQACDPYLDKCGAFEEISKSVVMGEQIKMPELITQEPLWWGITKMAKYNLQ